MLRKLFTALGLLPSLTQAGALYLYEMSNASESSYAGACLVARANDSGTVFTNPAGMTRFGDSAMLAGATGVYIDGGLTWLYEGNLEIEDQTGSGGGRTHSKFSNVSIYFVSFYAMWD